MTPAATAVFLQGLLTMAGLIVAIGAQNAQVLRQGLARRHVGAVVLLCIVSDWLLVVAGVFGLGELIGGQPGLMAVVRWGGAAFLLWCAWRALQRALRPQGGLAAAAQGAGFGQALATTAALTWLNPHVYLDTVVLMGSLGAQLAPALRAPYAAGAGLASALWFAALGYGAAALAPRLSRPGTWRAIDATVALVMAAVALQLLTARPGA
jgi:L-lysine exporter family protein LysE/ArgO